MHISSTLYHVFVILVFRYEVDDIDEEQKERHTLSRRKVIPLPTRRACPETNPEALYEPGTKGLIYVA